MDNSTFLPPHEIHEIGDFSALSQATGWGLSDLNIPSLWADTKGENVTVMVIDTGFSPHYDIYDNLIIDKAKSFIKNEVFDGNGHGTMVSGVIVAKDDVNGIVGVAPKAKVIPVKGLPDSGMLNDSRILTKCLEYALEIKPDIVNMSLGGYGRYEQRFEDILNQLWDLNIPVVCAAGNRADMPVSYPANYEKTIGVASYKKGREISSFSPSGENIDFALPGEQITTTTLKDQYAVVSGSSFAAPFMAGVIALMISRYKTLNRLYTVQSIVDKLKEKCIKIDGKDHHEKFGYGIIDIKELKDL